jgi:hypothetical protein
MRGWVIFDAHYKTRDIVDRKSLRTIVVAVKGRGRAMERREQPPKAGEQRTAQMSGSVYEWMRDEGALSF